MANRTQTTITALRYENGKVFLRLNPFHRLEGLYLCCIELDGSFGLVLSASSATAGTLTWSVAEAPWEAGDQLMLRITSAAPLSRDRRHGMDDRS